jgi:hypothetical protein
MVLPRARDRLGNNGDVLGYCAQAGRAGPSNEAGEYMSGHGHRIFVDELERFAADVADTRCAAIADRLTTPLRVAVSGRRAVGRGTVAHALARAGGAARLPEGPERIAVTTSPNADLDVYVIAEVVKPEDRDAIAAARRPVLAVLNKADLIGAPQRRANLHGATTAAKTRCARFSALTGVPMQPVVGVLAVAVLDDLLDDTLWAALRVLATQPADLSSPDSFLAGEHSVPAEVRRRLLDTLDLFGITQAVAAIRRGASAGEIRALLRRLSCIDSVVDKISTVGAQAYYQRVLDAVAELEALAVTDRRVGDFLSRDDTVIARMMAAVDVVEAAGMAVDRCGNAAAHLRRAVSWQRYSRGPVGGMHRNCGADIVRGSLRLWSKAGRSA